MRGITHFSARRSLVLFCTAFAALLLAAPAGAALTDNFVSTGNAQARWINEPAAPPFSTDTKSIELSVQARSAIDYNDAAWVTFRGFASTPPTTPPSFVYKLNQTGSSGGSVRLVMRFSDGGYGFLRPAALQAGVWSLANGAGRNWESKDGKVPCGTTLLYSEMLACHPGTTVTSVEVISDSGWLYSGRFAALIDNISYGGEVVMAPAPPVLGQSLNVAPVSGKVMARLPDVPDQVVRSDLDRVDGLVQGLPVGGKIDTRGGVVRLIALRGDARSSLQSGKFTGGAFSVGQASRGRRRGVVTLRLKASSRAGCTTTATARLSANGPLVRITRRRRGLLRRLRGNARGKFRTRGRYSSAISRGTEWTMSDRCEGTLLKVKKGKMAVRDFRRKRTIIVRAGQSYLAKAPGY